MRSVFADVTDIAGQHPVGVALMVNHQMLARLHCCPRRATAIAHAIPVLYHVEANRCAG